MPDVDEILDKAYRHVVRMNHELSLLEELLSKHGAKLRSDVFISKEINKLYDDCGRLKWTLYEMSDILQRSRMLVRYKSWLDYKIEEVLSFIRSKICKECDKA